MAKEGKKRGGYSTITGRKQARKMNMKILANQKDFNEIKYADFLKTGMQTSLLWSNFNEPE